jgi:hypothetical protein
MAVIRSSEAGGNSVMLQMLPPTTDNAPAAAGPAGSPAATASAASLDTLS